MTISAVEAHGLTGFSREAVEALSRRKGEPDWMRQFRLDAWAIYEQLPMPARTDEEWRRTDITAVRGKIEKGDVLSWAEPEAGEEALRHADDLSRELAGGDRRAGLIVQHNSAAIRQELEASLAAKGVIFTDLDTAVREHPALVQKHFMTDCVKPHDGKFAALHAAFWSGGAFLYVPRGVEVDLPLQAITYAEEPSLGLFTHSLVVVEPMSRVTFVESATSGETHGEGFASDVTELIVGDGAGLRCIHLQEWGPRVQSFSLQRVLLGRDAAINWLVVTLGGRMSRADIQAHLNGPGATAEMLGIFFGDGNQHLDHHTRQVHNAPHASSDLLYKGTLNDKARSVFSGLIRVAPGAQKTDSYQLNRNLLLSDKARADSIPNLEIGANDVRCTHGSSVGPVDKEHLFYLMSHGLTRADATKMIVEGFFEPVVARIPLEGVRDRLWASIERKMRL
jgi:Fe-S cluster assembly protein SufD